MQGIQIFAIIAYDYSIDNKVEKIRSKRGDDPVVKLVNTKEPISKFCLIIKFTNFFGTKLLFNFSCVKF